jgi:predicted neutral ceramidase superfamily lipid hydrolase
MRFRYETGVITLVQFIVMSLLNIANGLNSIVTTCHNTGSDCISNLIVSLVFFILITAWFAFIWILGYAAQERRSKRLAQLLIAAEGTIALFAYFNARHHTDWLSLATSIIDLVLAMWVIILAFRLMRAKGGRVVARQSGRRRRRRPPTAGQ